MMRDLTESSRDQVPKKGVWCLLIDDLMECSALRFGDFTLTSGRRSTYYVDIKKASARPDMLRKITDGFTAFGITADRTAGVELGAVPLITAYSLKNDIPFIIIRKGGRNHGTGKRIEGEISDGERILLLEDVVTSGGSVLEAMDLIEEAGGKIAAVLTVVDREEGGTDQIAARAPFHSLIRARELLEEAERRK